MKITDKIYVAGHNGLVGSAIVRLLKSKGYTNIITRTSSELDLRNQTVVKDFFEKEKPEYSGCPRLLGTNRTRRRRIRF